MTNITLFSQIISKLDRSAFNKLVKEKQTDKHQKGYNNWAHLVSMLFCSRSFGTKSQYVRDISNGLRSATGNLNHLGVERAPSKSTISYRNKVRNREIFKDYYFSLLKNLGRQAATKSGGGMPCFDVFAEKALPKTGTSLFKATEYCPLVG